MSTKDRGLPSTWAGLHGWWQWLRGKNSPAAPPQSLFGDYVVSRLLRETDCSRVFLATVRDSARCVVLKTLDLSSSTQLQRERFEREIRIIGQLQNPHSVRLVQCGEEQGQRYLSLEGVSGLTLDRFVQRCGPICDGRAIPLLLQICSGLGEVHTQGLIHRDIKPANLMVSCRGGMPDWLTVLDFGLAEPIQTEVSKGIFGTPAFLSPEAATLESPLDARSDIYSLGCVAYFLLAGRPPFDSPNPIELCWRHANHAPPSLASTATHPIAEPLADLIMECLEKSPSARPQSVHELATRLEQIQPLHSWTTSQAEQWWTASSLES